MLTIGPRFGGAVDDAARYFKDAYDRVRFVHSLLKFKLSWCFLSLFSLRYYVASCFLQNLTPYEFVESMKKKGIRVPGIGHRYNDSLFTSYNILGCSQFGFSDWLFKWLIDGLIIVE